MNIKWTAHSFWHVFLLELDTVYFLVQRYLMKPVLDLYSGSSAENQPTELQHIFIILLMELTAILFNSGSEELEPTLEYYFVNIL